MGVKAKRNKERKAKKAEAEKPAASAPAVHSDEMWGGPQLIDAATPEPVLVRTKKEYFDLLNRTGFRMKDQAESTTGPKREPEPAPLPPELRPSPDVLPLTQDEAQIFGAIAAVYRRYGLLETIWCNDCFERHRSHGCEMIVQSSLVRLRCRCGQADYVPPKGTTDLALNTIANTYVVELDKMGGTVLMNYGPIFRPGITLQDMEALLVRRYVAVLRSRNKEPRWFHKDCYQGVPQIEDNALAMHVDANDVVLVCKCRILMHRKHRIEAPAVTAQIPGVH